MLFLEGKSSDKILSLTYQRTHTIVLAEKQQIIRLIMTIFVTGEFLFF